jgi:hypothetical protein
MRDLVEKIVKTAFPLAAMLAVVGGCQSHRDADDDDDGNSRDAMKFRDAEEVSPVTRFVNEQANAGARTDATLRAYHFEHGRLNSLGRERLDQITADLGGEDNGDDNNADLSVDDRLVVYLDLPAGETDAQKHLTQVRQDAVTNYLISRGVSEQSFKLESGSNPENTSFAASLRPKESAAGADASAAKTTSTTGSNSTSTTGGGSSGMK